MELTYQQVLAEVYEETSKNVLVHQTEYEDEEKPAYEKYDYEEHELPDPEEFNKFHGDRNKPEHVIQPPKKSDGLGLASIKKDSIFRTNVINIDGSFRSFAIPVTTDAKDCRGNSISTESSLLPASVQSGTNFIFRTARQYKNVYSVEVTSIEFPNSFYAFSDARGNVSFNISYDGINNILVKIPDGNYENIVNTTTGSPYLPKNPDANPPVTTDNVPDTTTLLGAIQYKINETTFLPDLQILYLQHQHLVYFVDAQKNRFRLTFPSNSTNAYNNGIGYNLGFLQTNYTSRSQALRGDFFNAGILIESLIAETFPDTIQDKYIYLKLSDWDLLTHQTLRQTTFTAFLKIPLTVPKFTLQFDNNSLNTTTKKYFFHQPTNVNTIQVSLLDNYGNLIDLQYGTFSLTLQIQEVLSTPAYEQLLDNS